MEAIISYLCKFATFKKEVTLQWMTRRNQHIVAALHLAVSMNAWLLYDPSGVELKRLILF